ncbi:dehydrogenase/reductase SDR family member 7C-B-like [Gadus macrocephalus]|uniref:dehydrogenase/reductase SDR family member 7C-B-like n=1 Tax=Gadus macrocephalus TaxID=80720 RepID=UPI0028CBB4F2|nr:dehydrogenase/reductase SDR family member 7C-B-like [Gadus macrocephalus]
MDPVLTSVVLVVPCVLVVLAGMVYLYGLMVHLFSQTSVRNKVVVISDALSSLGRECASVFHRGGARLILCGRSWEQLEGVADELSASSDPTTTFLPKLVLLDFGDLGSMPEVVTEVMECYGSLDLLILNSSLKVRAPAAAVSLETERLLMDYNYFGPVTLAKGVLPSMISRRTGHLLLVNSIQGRLAVPFRTTYAASKHAVQAFFDCLRPEVQEYGISVSTLSHTFICSASTQQPISAKPYWSFLYGPTPLGVTPGAAVREIVRTVNDKRNEVVIAPSLPKAAICARSFFPNLFFAVMAAGVESSAVLESQ